MHLFSPVELLFLVALLAAFSSYRSIYGRRYAPVRLISSTSIYSIIALLFIFTTFYLALLIITILMISAGAVTGLLGGGSVLFYVKLEHSFYARSRVVFVIWLALLVAREMMEFIRASIPLLALLNAMLAFSIGLVCGEVYHIIAHAPSRGEA